MKERFLIVALVICNIFLGAICIYLITTTPKIYSVGVNRVVQSFTKQLDAANLEDTARDTHVEKFAKTLEVELKTLVKPRDILVMEEAVISGVRDITDILANNLKGKLHENTK